MAQFWDTRNRTGLQEWNERAQHLERFRNLTRAKAIEIWRRTEKLAVRSTFLHNINARELKISRKTHIALKGEISLHRWNWLILDIPAVEAVLVPDFYPTIRDGADGWNLVVGRQPGHRQVRQQLKAKNTPVPTDRSLNKRHQLTFSPLQIRFK